MVCDPQAAKLSIGYTLDQIPNDITQKTPASFEPSIDYMVTKIPRFAFEKFPGSTPELTTQMKSVGEAMSIGRTFPESFQKALRSLETGLDGWSLPKNYKRLYGDELNRALRVPNPERMLAIKQAFEDGYSAAQIHVIGHAVYPIPFHRPVVFRPGFDIHRSLVSVSFGGAARNRNVAKIADPRWPLQRRNVPGQEKRLQRSADSPMLKHISRRSASRSEVTRRHSNHETCGYLCC